MTNIFILAFSLVSTNAEITYFAPAGIYNVEYAFTSPERAGQGLAIWRQSRLSVTNDVTGMNKIGFVVPSVPAISFRLKKVSWQSYRHW